MGLEKLIDILLGVIDLFKFWEVVDEYEEAVVLRLGRYHRTLGPGIHWVIPFAVERVISDNVTTRTKNLVAQALTTKDSKQITLSIIVRARISNIRRALLETEGVDDTLKDSVIAQVAEQVQYHNWDEVRAPEFSEKLTQICRKQAFKYGIEIELVRFSDLTLTRNFTQMRIG